MAANLMIALLGTWILMMINGHPMPENEDIIPGIFISAESLQNIQRNTSMSQVEPTESLNKPSNEEQSTEETSTGQPLEEASRNNETLPETTPYPLDAAVMIKSKDEPTANEPQSNQQDVSTTPQPSQQQSPNQKQNTPNPQPSQQQTDTQPMQIIQQPKQIHFVIPAPNQLPNYVPVQPLYFNSSHLPSQPQQPQFIINQPPPMQPLSPFPPPMMFPSPYFPPPTFIMVQPGTNTQAIPPTKQPTDQSSLKKLSGQLPIFYIPPPNSPHVNSQQPFPMAGSPPGTSQLPQFVLLNQQTNPSDTVIGQSSIFLSQPNQNQEFIIVRSK